MSTLPAVGSCNLSPILLLALAHAFNATARGIRAAAESIWPCLPDLRTAAGRSTRGGTARGGVFPTSVLVVLLGQVTLGS